MLLHCGGYGFLHNICANTNIYSATVVADLLYGYGYGYSIFSVNSGTKQNHLKLAIFPIKEPDMKFSLQNYYSQLNFEINQT